MCRRVTEEADGERLGDKVAEPLSSTASAGVATPSPAGLTLTCSPTAEADSVLTASPHQVLAAHVERGAGRPPVHDLCSNDHLTRLRLGLPSSRDIGTGGSNSTSSAGCFPCEAGVVAGLRALRQKVAEKAGRTVKKMFFVQGTDVNKKSSSSEKTPDSWWDVDREEQLLNRGCLTSRMREQATTGSLQITTRYEVSPDDQDHPTLGVLPPYYNHDRTNDFRFLPAGIL
eukprot:g5167.t1